jgi:multicomponent Na+:H+ antiporter subunit A
VVPSLLDTLIGAAASALDPEAYGVHLAIWHGFKMPLLLSALTLAGGVALFAERRAVSRFQARFAGRVPDGTEGYLALLRGSNTLADRLTSVLQNGSLPTYVGVILLTAACVPALVLAARSATSRSWWTAPCTWSSPW